MADASVILTALTGGKVYPVQAPDRAVPPYSVYLTVGQPTLNTFKGRNNLQQHLVQIECWDKTYIGAHSLAESTVDSMLAAKFDVGSPAGLFTATLHDQRDTTDDDAKLYGVILEFSVWTK